MYIGTVRASRNVLVRNLSRVYRRASGADVVSGTDWYDNAHAIIREWSAFYGVSIPVVANVVAAISPQCAWERNLIVADEVLRGFDTLSLSHGPLRANAIKAARIYRERAEDISPYFPTGPKVQSFAANLAGNLTDVVTIDRHAIEAAWDDVLLPENDAKATFPFYLEYARAYMVAAKRVNIAPAVFQAIVWCTWKRENPAANKRTARRGF